MVWTYAQGSCGQGMMNSRQKEKKVLHFAAVELF